MVPHFDTGIELSSFRVFWSTSILLAFSSFAAWFLSATYVILSSTFKSLYSALCLCSCSEGLVPPSFIERHVLLAFLLLLVLLATTMLSSSRRTRKKDDEIATLAFLAPPASSRSSCYHTESLKQTLLKSRSSSSCRILILSGTHRSSFPLLVCSLIKRSDSNFRQPPPDFGFSHGSNDPSIRFSLF